MPLQRIVVRNDALCDKTSRHQNGPQTLDAEGRPKHEDDKPAKQIVLPRCCQRTRGKRHIPPSTCPFEVRKVPRWRLFEFPPVVLRGTILDPRGYIRNGKPGQGWNTTVVARLRLLVTVLRAYCTCRFVAVVVFVLGIPLASRRGGA